MTSIPDSLARLFDPLDALLADPLVERVLMGEGLHVRRDGAWTSQALPFPAGVLAQAVADLVPESGALELTLDAGATLLAFAPPVVERPVLSLRRRAPVAEDAELLEPRTAWDTLDIAAERALNLLVVSADPRARRAFMATFVGRVGGGAVLVDLPEVTLDDARLIRLHAADEGELLGWAPRIGGLRVCWDATPSGADAAVSLLAGRRAPALIGVPGRRAADGVAWLTGQAERTRAAVLLGAGVDLIVCVDGALVTAVEAVEATPTGPQLRPLHLALPSGALTEERAHTDWIARWQRVGGGAPMASLPPTSLTDALRAARAQAVDSALPVTDVPTLSASGDEAEATVDGSDSIDPLAALLAQLGEGSALEEDVDLDLGEDDEDEHEETMVQVESAVPRSSRRTFSEILRSLDEDAAAPRPMHVRRGERITQIRDED